MDEGRDFDGTLAIGDQAIDYLGLCGQMPWLDHWLDKNPVYPLGPPNLANVTRIAFENLTARLKGEDDTFNPEKPDFLQYFIDSKGTHPEIVNEGTIIGYLLLNCELFPQLKLLQRLTCRNSDCRSRYDSDNDACTILLLPQGPAYLEATGSRSHLYDPSGQARALCHSPRAPIP